MVNNVNVFSIILNSLNIIDGSILPITITKSNIVYVFFYLVLFLLKLLFKERKMRKPEPKHDPDPTSKILYNTEGK